MEKRRGIESLPVEIVVYIFSELSWDECISPESILPLTSKWVRKMFLMSRRYVSTVHWGKTSKNHDLGLPLEGWASMFSQSTILDDFEIPSWFDLNCSSLNSYHYDTVRTIWIPEDCELITSEENIYSKLFELFPSLDCLQVDTSVNSRKNPNIINILSSLPSQIKTLRVTGYSQLSIPTNFGSIVTSLQTLDLVKALSHNVDATFASFPIVFPNLTALSLKNLSLSSTGYLPHICKMTGLKSLNLSYYQISNSRGCSNQLNEHTMQPLTCLSNLTRLNVSHSCIFTPQTVKFLYNLKNSSSQLKRIQWDGSLRGLDQWDVGDWDEDNLNLPAEEKQARLASRAQFHEDIISLDPEKRKLFASYPEAVPLLSNLTNLTDLATSYLAKSLEFLPLLPNLTSLDHTESTPVDTMTVISQMTKLNNLRLYHLTNDHLAYLTTLTNLTKLDISKSTFTDEGLKTLFYNQKANAHDGLSKIKVLTLEHCQDFSDAGIAFLEANRPGLEKLKLMGCKQLTIDVEGPRRKKTGFRIIPREPHHSICDWSGQELTPERQQQFKINCFVRLAIGPEDPNLCGWEKIYFRIIQIDEDNNNKTKIIYGEACATYRMDQPRPYVDDGDIICFTLEDVFEFPDWDE